MGNYPGVRIPFSAPKAAGHISCPAAFDIGNEGRLRFVRGNVVADALRERAKSLSLRQKGRKLNNNLRPYFCIKKPTHYKKRFGLNIKLLICDK